MTLSSFCLIVGVFLYAVGFPLVFLDSKHTTWRKKLVRDEFTLRLIGIAVAALCITTLKLQWEVSPDGEGFVVAIVWIGLLKGALLAWFPSWVTKIEVWIEDTLLGSEGAQIFTGLITILIAAFFTYLGLVLPA